MASKFTSVILSQVNTKIGSLINLNGKLKIHQAFPFLFVLMTDLTLFSITCLAKDFLYNQQ